MRILIDDNNYHTFSEDEEEHKYVEKIISLVSGKYKDFDSVIKKEEQTLLYNLVKGAIKEYKDKEEEKTLDNLLDFIYYNVTNEIEDAKENNELIHFNSWFAYEPTNVNTYHLLISLQKELLQRNPGEQDSIFAKNYHEEEQEVILSLVQNILRSIQSQFVLFSIGDDMHAYGLFRGIIEQYSRLKLINDHKDYLKTYLQYLTYNEILQKIKNNISISKEDGRSLQEFQKKNEISSSKLENTLLYGWAKDERGNTITSSSVLIQTANQPQASAILKVYHLASEFIHEDYLNIDYNYMVLRVKSKQTMQEFVMNIEAYLQNQGIIKQ